MAQLSQITIDKYRSINHLELNFPPNKPVVLIGENNAGKSNILEAIHLLLGESWPSNYKPEEHEFFQRDPDQPILLKAFFSEPLGKFREISWHYDNSNDGNPIEYKGTTTSGINGQYISNDDREELICVKISADRRLNYQASYRSKYTMLSKLMHRFHKVLQSYEEIRDDLEGRFEDIKCLFHEIDEFKNFRDSLRKDFSDFVSTMSYKLEIDFEAYNPTNFFHALRLQADEDGTTRTFDELGTGEEQILAISFAHAYAKAFHSGILLAIEEPEAHLHPLAQDWLGQKITDLCKDGLQIIIETHSPSFVDVLNLDGLVRIEKSDNVTKAVQHSTKEFTQYCIEHGAPPDKTTPDNILRFYESNATKTILEGFFARRIVLVEGPTESLALPIYFNTMNFNTSRYGVAIIPVGGKGNIAKWVRMFTAYNIPTYVIFDNHLEDDDKGIKREDILRTLGEDDISTILEKDKLYIQNSYAVFGNDFEACLRSLLSEFGYKELENQAEKEQKVGTKPFKARYVANQICKGCSGEEASWDEFKELIEKIKACTSTLTIESSETEIEENYDEVPF